jgi:hypothetical protein
MTWESPSYVEVRMDAEIGSYQEDYDPANNSPVCSDDDLPADE